MPLLTFATVMLLSGPGYSPKEGDPAIVYTETLRPDRFAEYSTRVLADFEKVADRINPDITYQLEDAANSRVFAISIFADAKRRKEGAQTSEMRAARAKLEPYRAAPGHYFPAMVERLDLGRPPRIGDVVYVYTHTAKPGMFEDLRRNHLGKVAQRFKEVLPQTSRVTLADPAHGRIIDCLFFPNQAMADKIHRSVKRAHILEDTEPYRNGYSAERFVLAAIR
ncbi:hypothetical protein BH11ARM2_BH11ARM2_37160 [soil metagenome]